MTRRQETETAIEKTGGGIRIIEDHDGTECDLCHEHTTKLVQLFDYQSGRVGRIANIVNVCVQCISEAYRAASPEWAPIESWVVRRAASGEPVVMTKPWSESHIGTRNILHDELQRVLGDAKAVRIVVLPMELR